MIPRITSQSPNPKPGSRRSKSSLSLHNTCAAVEGHSAVSTGPAGLELVKLIATKQPLKLSSLQLGQAGGEGTRTSESGSKWVVKIPKLYFHPRRLSVLFFWRDQTGHEVDLLLEAGGGWYPVEIKSGMTVATDMFAGLVWWCVLVGISVANVTLVHGGDEAYERQGIAVRPWCAV